MTGSASNLEQSATIRLSGQAVENNAVPADVLVRTVDGMQQLVYLLAASQTDRRFASRFRIPEKLEQEYRLLCMPAKAGSYAVPLALYPLEHFGQLPILDDRQSVFDTVEKVFAAIVRGAVDELSKIFQDRGYEKRALLEIRKFLPKADEPWQLGFLRSNQTTEVILKSDCLKKIDGILLRHVPEESRMTITGELIRIDFDERKLTLRYPPTKKLIECIYSDDVEDSMIENRRQYVQVTGEFTLDNEGLPIKLTQVLSMEPLDLAPFELKYLDYNGRLFRFKHVLRLSPFLDDDSKQLLTVIEPELGLDACGTTRIELIDDVIAQIDYNWTEFACCDDDALTEDAKMLKKSLLEKLEVRTNAA